MSFKIPLFESKSLGFPRDMVTFSVRYKTIPILNCTGIIDTGCPYVVLSETSIKRTRIPYKSLPEKGILQLGKIPLNLRELGTCRLFFLDDKKKIITFNHMVYVGIPNIREEIRHKIPSFLGKEFIDKHYLSIMKMREGKFIYGK